MSTIVREPATERPIDQEGDFVKLNAVDHVEFWVGNAKQTAHFYCSTMGF